MNWLSARAAKWRVVGPDRVDGGVEVCQGNECEASVDGLGGLELCAELERWLTL